MPMDAVQDIDRALQEQGIELAILQWRVAYGRRFRAGKGSLMSEAHADAARLEEHPRMSDPDAETTTEACLS